MICLLGEPEDSQLLWLAAALRRRGEQVEVVSAEELMMSSALTYRIDGSAVSSRLILQDGRHIGGSTLRLVVNRLTAIPSITGAETADDGYIAEEWRAVLTAWLRTLPCPVLNPPRAATCCGPLLSPVVLRSIAAAHQLTAAPWSSDLFEPPLHPVEVLLIGPRCSDPQGVTTPAMRRSLTAMARNVGTPLLGITLDRTDTNVRVLEAAVVPALTPAGNYLIDALVHAAAVGSVW